MQRRHPVIFCNDVGAIEVLQEPGSTLQNIVASSLSLAKRRLPLKNFLDKLTAILKISILILPLIFSQMKKAETVQLMLTKRKFFADKAAQNSSFGVSTGCPVCHIDESKFASRSAPSLQRNPSLVVFNRSSPM